jgi:uncharacterized protein (TIGR03435 family)
MATLRILTVLSILHTSPIVFAQAVSAPAPTAVVDSANTKPLTYDVVSIRENKALTGGGGSTLPDGESMTGTFLNGFIASSYGISLQFITGLPHWAETNRYDIRLKVAAEDLAAYHKLNRVQVRLMNQAVLADRFKLAAHIEVKELPIYALVVAKGGPKLRESKPGDTYSNGIKKPDGTPSGPGMMMSNGKLIGQQVPVGFLLGLLSSNTHRTVVDKTGLTGRYDISLQWTPDEGPSADPNADAPSLTTALEEQLGLKLVSTKGPVKTLVVDHIEPLTEN